MNYTAVEWLMFFFVYSIIGWIYESIEVSIRTHKLTNRGFMRGPMLPIYGSGACVMVMVGMPLREYPVAMFFAGLVVCTILEYGTGEAMEALFKVRYWDYSKSFLNFRGHICLVASLAWGSFTLVINYLIHNPIERFVLSIPQDVLQAIVMVLTVYFVADFSLAFKTAMDLRGVLIAMDRLKAEMEHMEKRMDVLMAFAHQDEQDVKDMVHARMDERIAIANRRLEELKKLSEQNRIENESKKEEILEEIAQMRIGAALLSQSIKEDARERSFLYRNMLRNNPVMASRKYGDALAELKERMNYNKK